MGMGWPVSSDKWKAPLDCNLNNLPPAIGSFRLLIATLLCSQRSENAWVLSLFKLSNMCLGRASQHLRFGSCLLRLLWFKFQQISS